MTIPISATDPIGANTVLTIGNYGGTGYAPVNGIIDDFRITKGVARHTASFTPPTISALS